MSGAPRISVVVPSYNHADFVEAAVRSALEADRRREAEVVVIDDGSTDGTRERLRELAGEARVRIFEQENRGAHAALNRGLELAQGELIFLLDSDDLFEPERIETLARVLEAEPDAMLVGSWIRVVDEAGASLGVKHAWRDLPPWPQPRRGPSLSDLGDAGLALLETNYLSTTSNVAFRRSLIDEHGLRFEALRYAHDWDFFLAAARRGRIAVVEEPLVRYRVHGENTIAEGAERGPGRGEMRFEILWVVARHFEPLIAVAVERGCDEEELRSRARCSLPRFGRSDVLSQLLGLRGTGEQPAAGFERLLDSSHPLRRRASEALAAEKS